MSEKSIEKKIKIFTISDHPLQYSGVGICARYIIEGLLKTGKYQVISFGGAIKHANYQPMKTEEYGDDWIIYPVNGFGNADMVRSVIRTERPDILWFQSDPRFYYWLFDIANEVRPLLPTVWYTIWDNYPYPTYNKALYESNDYLVAISKVTHDIISTVAPDVENSRIPHTFDPVYKIYPADEILKFRQASLPNNGSLDKTIFFWNGRNARRKQTGSLIFWFKEFLDIVGHDKATLILHTDPKDQQGQDLVAIINELKITDGQIIFSTAKLPPDAMAKMYNMADCFINISDAEGWGMPVTEALACGVPVIVNMTGGLQEQVTDGDGNWFGIGIEPSSKAVIGSQPIPFIFEDRINKDDFIKALLKMHNMPKEDREEMGRKGQEYVQRNYNLEDHQKRWDEVFQHIHEKYGSWNTRKGYKSWVMENV